MRRTGVRRWLRLRILDRLRTGADVQAELDAHLEMSVERLMAKGLGEVEARAEAERRLGGVRRARRMLEREAWSRDVTLSRRERLHTCLDDLRYSVRVLRRDPAFTAVAIGSLALAFALITSTTALVNAYLIRSMPYPHAERLYHVNYAVPGQPEPRGLSSLDWSALGNVVEHADNSAISRMYIGVGADREEMMGLLAAPGSLALLGVRVAFGRSLHPDDFAAGAEPVALIAQDLWRRRFGGDTSALGRSFVSSRASTGATELIRIVGVLPDDFRFARAYSRGALDFVMPLREPFRTYMVRLHSGVSPDYAERAIDDAVRRAGTWFPPGWNGVRMESVHAGYVAPVRPVLLAIAAACTLVLVITCINLAVLMLLRSLRRQREWAVRAALGAGRIRLLRMQLLESGIVCWTGLVLGVVASIAGLRVVAPIVEERLGRAAPGGTQAIGADWRVLLITAGVGLLVALALGLVPLLVSWRRRPAAMLRRASTNATGGVGALRMRSMLLASQVAASVALLVGGGLMARTVFALLRTDLGYRTEHVLRARIALTPDRYTDPRSFLGFYDRLTERLAASPAPFALTTVFPFFESPQQPVELEGHAQESFDASHEAVSERYFEVFGIRLLEGRRFTSADRLGAAPVAIVSSFLASRLVPGGSALGRRIRIGSVEGSTESGEWRTIVGVSSNVRQTHTDRDLDNIYVPFAQSPGEYAPLYVRTTEPPLAWATRLRELVAEIDPHVLVTADDAPMHVQEQRQLAGRRFLMSVLIAFAVIAAFLTALGVYGVTAYVVEQRARELAIRAALGATRRRLQLLFLTDALRILAVGIAVGLLGAAASGPMLRNQLFGVEPLDVATLLTACALVATVALAATWLPTVRGTGRQPMPVLSEQ